MKEIINSFDALPAVNVEVIGVTLMEPEFREVSPEACVAGIARIRGVKNAA